MADSSIFDSDVFFFSLFFLIHHDILIVIQDSGIVLVKLNLKQ